MKHIFLLIGILFLMLLFNSLMAQGYITRSVKSFGAKGDGKANDTKAFQAAADFFNKRGGNGKLTIPSGTYMVGEQMTKQEQLEGIGANGKSILQFINCKNVIVEGTKSSIIKYTSGLKFGSFDPLTGSVNEKNSRTIPDRKQGLAIGYCIAIFNCSNIQVKQLVLNGNNKNLKFGGIFGDVGIQLPHNGIIIANSRVIKIDNINASYFGLDGIAIANIESNQLDSIFLSNSTFEYNTRQGCSWTGGNFLIVKNCSFNHTGQGKYFSRPAAGFDIEAEVGPVHNGRFYNCNFINNIGPGMGADTGNSYDCSFTDCTFWGPDNWTVFVTKPKFTFRGCNLYGATVRGYDSPTPANATKFINCYFEDKPYKGKEPKYSYFVIDSDNARCMIIDSCTIVSNKLKLAWLTAGNANESQRRIVSNTHFILKNTNVAANDFVLLFRNGVLFKNNILEFLDPKAKKMNYWPTACCAGDLIDLGGNKVIYR